MNSAYKPKPERKGRAVPWAIATYSGKDGFPVVVFGPSHVDAKANMLITQWEPMGGCIYTPLHLQGLAITWEDRCRPKPQEVQDHG